MKTLHGIAMALVLIGALNWGLVGLFNFNLVAALLGDGSALSRIVYSLVGLSALVVVVGLLPTKQGAPVTQS